MTCFSLPRRRSLMKTFLFLVWFQVIFLLIRYYHTPEMVTSLILSQNYPEYTEQRQTNYQYVYRHVSTLYNRNGNISLKEVCQEVNSRTQYEKKPPEKSPFMKPNGIFYLKDDKTEYFLKFGQLVCLKFGTSIMELYQSRLNSNITVQTCPCLAGWHGEHCSIPDSVYKSNLPKKFKPKIRLKPRKIIQALPFNNEFEMLEARFNELGQFVDVFMILESNYSAYGTPKPLRLLEKLKSGYCNEYSHKILHIFLGEFPEAARKNGWIADGLLRNHISLHGVTKQLRGYDHDDIFFLTDADELPKWETILFLKVHDNYPVPIGIHLEKHTFGFFWAGRINHIIGVVTMGFLMHVFDKHAYWIRSAPHYIHKQAVNVNTYLKTGGLVHTWSFGTKTDPAGWHCSWCCPLECILDKLVSAQNGDFPRWGDFPAKRNLTYIRHLVKTGTWFDDVSKLTKAKNNSAMYAPLHTVCNSDRYRHIFTNIYV